MKLNRLEAHDRLLYLKKDQEANIFLGAEECLKRNPDSVALQQKSPYIYIFAHPRTADDGVTKRLLWQPRLGIPEAQENSYLFRAISNTDLIETIWMIPPKEHWKQYRKGNVTESDICLWSINMLVNNKAELERPHPDDMPIERATAIWQSYIEEKMQKIRQDKMMNRCYDIEPVNNKFDEAKEYVFKEYDQLFKKLSD